MKHLALTSALAALVLLGFNAPSKALSPQSLGASAQMRTQSMAFGASEIVNITLHDGQLNYVVPTGKVLHVESLFWALESDSTHKVVSVTPANDVPGVGSLQISPGTGSDNLWSPDRPLRIAGDGNAGLHILKNTAVDWQDVVIFGQLTDA